MPLRATIRDHYYCFGKHSEHECFFLNLIDREAPSYLAKIDFDLVIFHTIFLNRRWSREAFDEAVGKVRFLKGTDALKVMLPQDEFINTSLLCDFINEFGIDVVFSVAPESEFRTIYPTVDFGKVQFHRVLTGYLDDETVAHVQSLASAVPRRDVDIGYRAWRAAAWLGRHGQLKATIADVFNEVAPRKGLKVDISTREEDVLGGDAWLEFLLRCKYQIGVEGGASILDADGSVRARTDAYVAAHPEASYEEIEAACFPGMDGGLNLIALSPRHLESAAARNCQILVEGDYNGILQPHRHYIPLKADYSNLDEVLDLVRDDRLREEMVERTYEEIVASRRYSYERFVAEVYETSFATRLRAPRSFLRETLDRFWTWRTRREEARRGEQVLQQ